MAKTKPPARLTKESFLAQIQAAYAKTGFYVARGTFYEKVDDDEYCCPLTAIANAHNEDFVGCHNMVIQECQRILGVDRDWLQDFYKAFDWPTRTYLVNEEANKCGKFVAANLKVDYERY